LIAASRPLDASGADEDIVAEDIEPGDDFTEEQED
jgi:hypothetical protein